MQCKVAKRIFQSYLSTFLSEEAFTVRLGIRNASAMVPESNLGNYRKRALSHYKWANVIIPQK